MTGTMFEISKTLDKILYEIGRPSFRFTPEIYRVSDGTWYAKYNCDDNKNHLLLIGHGNTPSEAVKDFDSKFYKR